MSRPSWSSVRELLRPGRLAVVPPTLAPRSPAVAPLLVGCAALLTLAGCGPGAAVVPAALWPDAPAPASVAAYLPSARAQLWSEATEGLRLPLHLQFIEARCAADGAVALVFREHRPPYRDSTSAYAIRGSMPTALDDAWGSGTGIDGTLFADDEFLHLMGRDHRPCAS